VAIESDGTEQYRRMSVRERSRLRPQLLERLGWRYMPLWTIEVFTDPSACADRIGGYLGLEKPAVTGFSPSSQGFFEDDVDNLTLTSAERASEASEREAAGSEDPSESGTESGAEPGTQSGSGEYGSVASAARPPVPLEEGGADREEPNSAGPGSEEYSKEDGMDTNSSEAGSRGGVPASGADGAAPNRGREAGAGVPAGVLPNKAAEDDPKRWGDHASDYDHDAWLQEQKPPHWG
jgi:hypothetical protein